MHYEKGESHGIPYRCLLARNVENLIVAGRAVSCDRYVFGSIRVMPVCMVTGSAAGFAAAEAARGNVSLRSIDIKNLQKHII